MLILLFFYREEESRIGSFPWPCCTVPGREWGKCEEKYHEISYHFVRLFLGWAFAWLLQILNWFIELPQSYFGQFIVVNSVFPWRNKGLEFPGLHLSDVTALQLSLIFFVHLPWVHSLDKICWVVRFLDICSIANTLLYPHKWMPAWLIRECNVHNYFLSVLRFVFSVFLYPLLLIEASCLFKSHFF